MSNLPLKKWYTLCLCNYDTEKLKLFKKFSKKKNKS